MTHLELLPELRVVHSGAWSGFSEAVSEAEADDDWDETDSLLPIDVSSVAWLELSPTADAEMQKTLLLSTASFYSFSATVKDAAYSGFLMIACLIKQLNNLSIHKAKLHQY